MELRVNGKPMQMPEGSTVADLVVRLGFGVRTVAVERNGEALPRPRFGEVELVAGDVLEVVRPVQGGDGSAVAGTHLYLVCDDTFPLASLRAVLTAGVDIVQLRMKGAEASEVIAWGEPMLDVCRRAGVPFIVNDRPDVALALGADGVHLGQGDLPPDVARRIAGPQTIIGRSTHSRAEIDAALEEHRQGHCDYIAVGPVHQTPTGPGKAAVGVELVAYAAEHVRIPWFAIGGLDPDNVGDVVAAGASRVAVVRAITQASDPASAARTLREALP
jgi:thiamine-phosphate pyrophosphorylase